MCYKCCFLSNKILVVISLPLGATKTTWLRKSHTHTPPHTQCCRCGLLKNGQCLICQPCECWSKGLGGGPIPVCPPGLTDSPFIWLKRLSSFMLLSCMPSMDWKHNEEKNGYNSALLLPLPPPSDTPCLKRCRYYLHLMASTHVSNKCNTFALLHCCRYFYSIRVQNNLICRSIDLFCQGNNSCTLF